MYVDIIPNRSSPPAVLLREAYRKNGKSAKRTIGNISHLPLEDILALKKFLGKKKEDRREILFCDMKFKIERSLPHGHVKAVLGTLRKLGLDKMISSRRCRERDIIVALIVERLIHPGSKPAATRTLGSSTLAEDLELTDVGSDEVYSALAWLNERKSRIEKKLAATHLSEGGMALYDIAGSSYYGKTCSLGTFARGKKGRKKGIPCMAYGVMTDPDGRPVAVDTYPGKTGDPATVLDQVEKLQKLFVLSRVVLVADRGTITNTRIENLKKYPGIGWITAMKAFHLRGLVESGDLQVSLFDEKNLAEISSLLYPGERLVACFNPLLQQRRRVKREALIAATEKELEKLEREVCRRTGKPLMKEEIGLKAGKKVTKYKVAKHFELKIGDGSFSWRRREKAIEREADLDGIYIIRTSEPVEDMSAEDTVRNYRRLTMVERVFRSMKGLDLLVQPIYLSPEAHVTAHIFICMPAYYIEWHLRQSLAPVLFEDEELETAGKTRDPVKTAESSDSVRKKKITKLGKDGFPLHSLSTLLTDLGTLCSNKCRMDEFAAADVTINRFTEAAPLQKRVFRLLDL